MKIKKKDLRRGLAQLPINYPDPEVTPDALPGGVLDMDAELVQVELICKRLGHNEVVVRDAALAEVPKYLERLTKTLADMEEEYASEMASVAAYFAAHPRTHNPYKYDNIPLALSEFRQKTHDEDQRLRRRQAVRALKEQRKQQRLTEVNYGRYGAAAEGDHSSEEDDEEGEGRSGGHPDAEKVDKGPDDHKAKYSEWMQTWCDAELIFLKLARGLHFCLWHSDKPLVQLACAQRIADLIRYPATVRSKVLFYGSMFRVLAREWPTIDRYRMDKYLALVRRMVFAWVLLVKEVGAGSPATEAAAKTACPAKRGKAAAKRGRSSSSSSGAAEEKLESVDAAGTSPLSAANNAKGIPELYIKNNFSHQLQLSEALREMFYILQVQIFPSTTSVGLTMHVCDVAFDELTKAALPVPLFVTLTAGIPLYAMSQGNFVEKRVLDSFFPPLAGGVFAQRRAGQLLERMKEDQRKALKSKRKDGAALRLSEEDMAHEAARLAGMDNDTVLGEVARCCQLFSVSRGTARAVRVMFSEAELVLQQARSPDAYQTLTRTAQRRRIEHEIEEVNEIRGKVREARANKREEKRTEQQRSLREKVRARKEALLAKKAKRSAKTKGDGAEHADVDEKAIKKAILEEEKLSKTKKAPRDTKRKKNYRLTKQDLYASDDDEGDK